MTGFSSTLPSIVVRLTLVLLLAGCADPDELPPAPDAELIETLGLDGDEALHTVRLSGRGADEALTPATVEVEPSALVQFVVMDRRIHTVEFLADSLSGPAREFLEQTEQLAGPPLVERGSRFVVTFDDAPAGRYPFVSEAHGGRAYGAVIVRGPT